MSGSRRNARIQLLLLKSLVMSQCCCWYPARVVGILWRVLLLVVGHELSQSVNGDWEYYSGVVLSRNTVQCLQISQLKDIELKIEPVDLMFNKQELS